MYINEILHSCSNPHVAKAALRSSVGLFRDAIEARANAMNLDVGDYVAAFVRAFAAQAQPRDRQDLAAAIKSTDHPVLAGLKYILQNSAIEPDFVQRKNAIMPQLDKNEGQSNHKNIECCLWC